MRPGAAAAAVIAAASLAGCFYGGTINERPSAEIRRVGSGVPTRGGQLTFQALTDDPDGDPLTTSWRAEACDASPTPVCMTVQTGTDPVFSFRIPTAVDSKPTVSVSVYLEVADAYGAVARPPQGLRLDVVNNAPTLIVQRHGRELSGAFPPGVPIVVTARGGDPDGDAVTVAAELWPARDSNPDARSWTALADAPNGDKQWELVPDIAGEWTVHVTADDGQTVTTVDEPILVVPDRAPCLGATDPAPAPGGVIILDQPRRFGVLVVDDDLDVFPWPAAGDPYLGPAGFRWYVKPPGATAFSEVATDVPGLELDPAQYAPGERLDVRVEIDDRIGRTVACAPDQPTCSETQDQCLQRQTWTVEVR